MFRDYYIKYLNINAGINIKNCLVCKTSNRDIALNKRFTYKIIITDYNVRRVVSVSPAISDDTISNICTDIKKRNFDDILQSQQLLNSGYRISKMYRMTMSWEKPLESTRGNITAEYLYNYIKYIIRVNDKIVSYCKISNMDFGYGNIVVWTDENYRRRGYAREVLLMMIARCKSEGIEPVYLVNSQNIGSIELAKAVGFEIVQTEIIACEEIVP